MVLREQTTYELDEDQSQVEFIHQTTDAKQYVTDLLVELQAIARVSGLDDLSSDLKIVLARHLPK